MYVGQKLVINSGNTPSETVTVLSIGSTTQFNATFANNYVIGNTVRGFSILADEIVKDVLSVAVAVNSSQLSSSTALIQSPGLDLLNEVYEDEYPSDILNYLATRGDNQTTPRQWEAGVDEGQVLYFRPQFSTSRAWYVDVTDLELARTIDRLFNSAYGLYEEASGRTLRTANASDAASIAKYALTRRAPVPAQTTSATQAGITRDGYIADARDPLPRATLHFDAVYDAAGSRYPLYLVRAGDTLTVRNVPPNVSSSYDRVRTFRITHTNFSLITGTLDVEPEVAPPSIRSQLSAAQQIVPLNVRIIRTGGPRSNPQPATRGK
jgi:hypothetical protein